MLKYKIRKKILNLKNLAKQKKKKAIKRMNIKSERKKINKGG